MKSSMAAIGVGATLLLCALGLSYRSTHIHPEIREQHMQLDFYLPPVTCGALVRLSPNRAKLPDGSAIYFDNASGKVVAACDNPMRRDIDPAKRVRCPPAGWTCG